MKFPSRTGRQSNLKGNLLLGNVGSYTAQTFIIQHLKNANLHRAGSSSTDSLDQEFYSNKDFWKTILSAPQLSLKWVKLTNFQIVGWFPRHPGIYHTEHAANVRSSASEHVIEEDGVSFYDPWGKGYMIDGGLGAVRFKPITTLNGETCWLVTATSDGLCHTGVPVAIEENLWLQVDFKKNNFFQITGQVKFLPTFLDEHFSHWVKVPQIYIQADTIKPISNDEGTPVLITPMVFFTGHNIGHQYPSEYAVTYVSCFADSVNEIDAAASWLNDYATRYRGEIITNFDQQRPLFQHAPFSLQKVMDGNITTKSLDRLHIENAQVICEKIEQIRTERMMSKIDIKLGDGTIIHGDFVVASTIENSFNKAESAQVQDELKHLLQDLAKNVATLSEALPRDKAEQVAKDLDILTSEAISPSPRKKWWHLSGEGIVEAAQAVGEKGKPVIELVSKTISLLSGTGA